MRRRLLSVAIERETDLVLVRQRARAIAEQIGFERQDQTRITTAVSEIVRNALDYGGGGSVEFWIGDEPRQHLEVLVRDQGPGIADLDAVLGGYYRSATGMGVGLVGARRLMDDFTVETGPSKGTGVRMAKHLPPRAPTVSKTEIARIGQRLSSDARLDPTEEIRLQNRDMLVQLDELQKRQEELSQLNQELHDTNRGVVALYAELEERADHLRRADELKSRFLSNMSHEFRTPLNSILALSRLLLTGRDGELTQEQEKQVQFIRRAAENLTDLVNDLLDIAKVEAGKTVVTPLSFTVSDLFGALRGMLRPLLIGDALSLVFEDAADLPPMLSDEGKISQILRNFISNAIKFTERGEVRIWAEAGPGADFVTFRVSDTGIGIAETDLEKIWQEFSQIAHPLQNRVKGTGLGLPLSRRLAELLGGRVEVASAPGQGSVFSLVLPRVYRHAVELDEDVEWRVEPGQAPVLVVEDNAADAFACERALAGSIYQAITARSTAQAKAALDKFPISAVLLDIKLTGEETWQFLLQLKQHDATRSIPVIMLSTTQEEMKARHLGADDYLHKPVDAAAIIRALDRVTGRHSVRRVLVVDDDEVSRYLVRQLLPRNAFEVNEAATGQAAIEFAARQRPDVVVLDLNMPTMSGFEFLQYWSAAKDTGTIPAVVLTSMILGEEQRRRLISASTILSKLDLSADALVAAIEGAIATGETPEAVPLL
jgi:signal transduction histidine kinase/CheY-like chemotaxis protein